MKFVKIATYASLVLVVSATNAQKPRYSAPPTSLLIALKRDDKGAREAMVGFGIDGRKPIIYCTWYDLNGDGQDEAFVWSASDQRGRLWDGGNRSDGFAIFQKRGNTYVNIGGGRYNRDSNMIGILKSSTGKWRDIASKSFTYGNDGDPRGNHWYPHRNRGKGYESEPRMIPGDPPPLIIINPESAPEYDLLSRLPLDESDLRKVSTKDLDKLRNGYFARNGLVLKRPDLRELFGSYGWYKPTTSNTDEVWKKMTDIERTNILLIQSIEKKRSDS